MSDVGKVTVTNSMLAAGLDAYDKWQEDAIYTTHRDRESDMVIQVYTAMTERRLVDDTPHKPIPEGDVITPDDEYGKDIGAPLKAELKDVLSVRQDAEHALETLSEAITSLGRAIYVAHPDSPRTRDGAD